MFKSLLKPNPNIVSEILRDIAQVFFATMFIEKIIDPIHTSWWIIVLGLIGSLIFWFGSLIITSNK
jgi:hypothetical protein